MSNQKPASASRKPSPAPEERRVKDLTPTAKDADGVRGGVKRRGGDDDLDDLEVER